MKFILNGTEQSNISGEVDWEQRIVNIPAGSHTFTWTYAKNGGGTAGADAAWLDQVVYTPEPGPPIILVQPLDQAARATSNATFTVAAANATGLPMSYQWFFNQTTPVGLPTSTLFITNVGAAQLGSYHVVVSNSFGSATSRVATLSLATPPGIAQGPQNQTVVAGDDVMFSVTVSNSATLPLYFQWRKGGFVLTNIVLNTQSCSFTLFNVATNVTLTNGPGTYRVIVTNAANAGSVNVNASATLAVLPAAAPTAATLAASGLTPNAATLNATVNPMGAQTVAWFDYGLTAAYGSRTSVTNVGNSASPISFAQRAGGLLPGTNYHYRIVATNYGGMAVGQDMTFQTAPLPRPILSSSTRLPDGRFRLQFTAPAGSTYTVLVSTNLLDWTPLGPAIETTPGHFEFIDADAPGHSQRFYRLRSP